MTGPFCAPYSMCLKTLASDGAVLYHNITFPILALLTIKHWSGFFEKGFRYSENLFYSYVIGNVQNFLSLSHKKHPDLWEGWLLSVMTSQILKFVDFTKTQKSKYLENKILFFLQMKSSLIRHQALLYGKNFFVEEVTFNFCLNWDYALLCIIFIIILGHHHCTSWTSVVINLGTFFWEGRSFNVL